MPRRRPKVVSTRASDWEAAFIQAAASAAGSSVNEWALARLLAAARDRLVPAVCTEATCVAVRLVRAAHDTWPEVAHCPALDGQGAPSEGRVYRSSAAPGRSEPIEQASPIEGDSTP